MITVKQAEAMILENIFPSAEEWISLPNLRDEWLKQDLAVNQNDPQFHRVTVDGVAIAWHVWNEGHRFFPIAEIDPEQNGPQCLSKPFECLRVRAGDSLPLGADCVVPLGSLTIQDEMACISNALSLRRWDHIQRMGSCYRHGELVLRRGSQLHSPEWAAAASAGVDGLKVAERPQIALVTAGWDKGAELEAAEYECMIGASKYGILSSLRAHGFQKINICRLEERIGAGRYLISQLLNEAQVVIFTDGSMQRMDREIPQAMTKAGVEKVFRRVRQQPGSDFFFGLGPDQQFVFGLPADPWSSLVIVHRFILPALTSIVSGRLPFAKRGQPHGILKQAVYPQQHNTVFIPVTIQFSSEGLIELEIKSSDMELLPGTMLGSDGFIEIESGADSIEERRTVPLWLWRQAWM